MEKIITGVILSALFLALVSAGTVRADEAIPDLSMGSAPVGELYYMDAEPGRIDSTGIYFEVKDSEWLNISVASSELIKLNLESLPNMITMHLSAAAGAASTQITIGGLAPDTTYHKYEDNYHNHEAFTTDDNGSYTYTQDLSAPHIVFIQTKKSTKFIKDDASGGDCYSIGIWDSATKTCTMTMDLTETIQIDSDNVTLDGNGHTITGSYTGNGVYLNGRTGVTVKNMSVSGFSTGIYLLLSNNNTIMANISSNNVHGIGLIFSNNSALINNVINSNYSGLTLQYSGNNTLSGNTMSTNRTHNFRVGDVYDNNIDTSNLVEGKPIYYIRNAQDQTYDATITAGTFICISCNNITIDGLSITTNKKNSDGILLIETHNSVIKNVTLSNNRTGIYLVSSTGNAIYNSIFSDNRLGGVSINASSNNTVSNNTTFNNSYGLYLYASSNNIIYNNTTSNNSYGLYLSASINNTIYNNNFVNNGPYGLRQTVLSSDSTNNIFVLPAPIGGNYWNNYDTAAEGCNELDGDGFCDAPYLFSGGQDNLPWTKQDGWKPSDSVAPTTTASLSGTSGNNGWYLSDVQVTLTVADNEGGSGVAKTEYSFDGTNWVTYSAPFIVSAEGTTTVYYKSMDSAGNAETANSLTVRIDKTPPTIIGTATASPNANDWYNSDVTVHFTASDNVSGIDTVTQDITISSEGANQSATGAAFDKAGNSATTTVSGINIDKTAPVITITSPAATQYDHSATINISVTATDNVSGVYKTTVYLDGQQYDPANPISLLYLSLGIHTLKVESENYAGLVASQSVDFEIIATAGGTTSLVTTLYQTGAIDSAGIVTSLTQQLQAAQAAISSGQTASAQNILEAFINMLEAQSGKHISSSAAEILMADALYMISQL